MATLLSSSWWTGISQTKRGFLKNSHERHLPPETARWDSLSRWSKRVTIVAYKPWLQPAKNKSTRYTGFSSPIPHKKISTISSFGMQENLISFSNRSVQARLGVFPEKLSKLGYPKQVIKALTQALSIYKNTIIKLPQEHPETNFALLVPVREYRNIP